MTIWFPDEHGTSSGVNHPQRHRDGAGFKRTPIFEAVSKFVQPGTTSLAENPRGVGLSTYGQIERLGSSTASPALLVGWWPRYGKRCFDIVFASIALILLAPAMILIAILVRVSGPGPVFFRQMRHGRDCKLFSIYKFQTMVVNNSASGIIMQAKEHDQRVTRIGAFLRRTSLDEIPQLFNVLAGDMSIVGPRPHAPLTAIGDTFFETLAMTEQYRIRFSIKPGITGLAQVSGCRGAMPTRETAIKRLENDVRYLRELSFWLDMKVIMRTLVSEFLTGKAY